MLLQFLVQKDLTIVFFPSPAKSYHDDKPFFAFLPEVKKNPEYKTLEFMSHLLGGSFKPWTYFADYPGAPMTAKFNLYGIPHLLKVYK